MNDSEESSKIIGRLKSPWTSFDKSDPKNDLCGRRQRPFFEAFPPLDFAGNYVEQARWARCIIGSTGTSQVWPQSSVATTSLQYRIIFDCSENQTWPFLAFFYWLLDFGWLLASGFWIWSFLRRKLGQFTVAYSRKRQRLSRKNHGVSHVQTYPESKRMSPQFF